MVLVDYIGIFFIPFFTCARQYFCFGHILCTCDIVNQESLLIVTLFNIIYLSFLFQKNNSLLLC